MAKNQIRTFSVTSTSMKIDLQHDIYGETFWLAAADGDWEASTFGYLVLKIRDGTPFIDCGAASGIFSIFAGKLGANVFAIEPHPAWLSCLHQNVRLNGLGTSIAVLEGAVSVEEGTTNFGSSRDSAILSDITLGGTDADKNEIVSIFSLSRILESATSVSALPPFIKMDIEGAEYKILSDVSTLKALRNVSASLFLSIHPGFPRDLRSRISEGWRGSLFAFLNRRRVALIGIIDNWRLFSRIRKEGVIHTPAGKKVKSPYHFVRLSMLGCDDFCVSFSS